MTSFLINPITTFVAGSILTLLVLGFSLSSATGPNLTADKVKAYRAAMAKAGINGPAAGSPEEKAALERFQNFLKNVGDKDYIEQETAKAYAPGAYLDDTIVTHHGPKEIKAYFLQTADTMTAFEVTIDDVSRSGPDHYVRWTMIFSAPKLGGGEPIHSVGISQVRFNEEGQVAFHQDFWDSGQNIYGQIPVVGGLINIIQNRMK
ncbi:MAG: nuclear transport factor 2 family protein [Verrucomicrobiaceae bacterium]